MQQRDTIFQIEIDTMIVDPEQLIDLDTLEPEKFMLIHCHAPPAPSFVKLSGCLAVFTKYPYYRGNRIVPIVVVFSAR